MKSRLLLVFMGLLSLWLAMFLRAAYLQIIPNDRLENLQRRQFATSVEVSGRRGIVVDRFGRELAASVGAQSLYADPAILEQPRLVTRRLAKLLKMSRNEIQVKIRNRERRFVWIKRRISAAEADSIKKWEIRGLGLVEEAKRVYPNNELLSQTLGFVGIDGDGLEGLELRYDRELKGEERKVVLPRDARGRPLLPEGGLLTSVQDGARIELTIDSQLQFILEKELEQTVTQYEADNAVGIVLSPKTGEILALASSPTFSSSDPFSAAPMARRNRAISDAFEAGSVMKTFVIASAIREGIVRPATRIDCEGGHFKVGGRWIREAEADHDFGMLSVAEILAYSSNVGTAKVALQLGPEKLRRALEMFGFGNKTEVDLPGESKGILNPLPWRPHLLSNISFGHGLAVTPIQIATAYAAIANGGWVKRPYIVRRIEKADESKEFTSENLRRVLSEEQAATMRLMLRAATMEHATGVKARIPGYPVAGKTGTAQKVDLQNGGYMKNAYISSFGGFVPAQDPEFVIFVAVDNPRKQYYASQVAAPVFARIAQYAVRQKGLPPVLLSEENLLKEGDKLAAEARKDLAKSLVTPLPGLVSEVPSLVGLTVREVLNRLRGSGIDVEIKGRGIVSSTYPGAGAVLPENKKIRVFLDPVE